jgi:hypothetical protein
MDRSQLEEQRTQRPMFSLPNLPGNYRCLSRSSKTGPEHRRSQSPACPMPALGAGMGDAAVAATMARWVCSRLRSVQVAALHRRRAGNPNLRIDASPARRMAERAIGVGGARALAARP